MKNNKKMSMKFSIFTAENKSLYMYIPRACFRNAVIFAVAGVNIRT